MAGTVIINLIMALIGFLLAFSFSSIHNGFITSMIRGVIATVSFFLITYIFRLLLTYVLTDKKNNEIDESFDEIPEFSLESLIDEDEKILSNHIQSLLNSAGDDKI